MRDASESEALRGRRAAIEMDPDAFRRAGHGLVDAVADLIGGIAARPVNRDEGPRALNALLPRELPETGADAAELLDETTRLLVEHSLYNGHPRFFGYITSSPAPIGMLADLLAAAVNPNLGGWQLSPLATEIEKQAVRWVARFVGFPDDGDGMFVSGGNMANFVAFLAARQARAPWALRERGLADGAGRMLVYATGETHTWIHKAADLFGHGTLSIRPIPTGPDQRADVAALPARLAADRAAGDHPFLLVATAGTVSTGAIDPIRRMREIADEHGLWLHVDGAYGAPAAAVPGADPDLVALATADSVAVDPHKWLYAPLEAGCVLVREPQALTAAFSYTPPYYHFDDETDEPRINFYERGLQNSRGFRALKVWLSLRQVGRAGFVRTIAEDCALAAALHRACVATPAIEARTLSLSIATFRYVPDDLGDGDDQTQLYLDRLNEELLSRLNRSGELFLSNAILDGRYLLRACIVNFRTSLEDVEALPAIVARHGRALDRELRGTM